VPKQMNVFEKLTPYTFELKIFISSNGYEFFKNPTTYFLQG
jgi:hypothetical protein